MREPSLICDTHLYYLYIENELMQHAFVLGLRIIKVYVVLICLYVCKNTSSTLLSGPSVPMSWCVSNFWPSEYRTTFTGLRFVVCGLWSVF